jgi:hypothetical protein
VTAEGDANFRYCYFGRSAHPFEILFVKTNREIFTEAYLDRLAYSQFARGEPSGDWSDCHFISNYVACLQTVSTSTALTPFDALVLGVDDICGWAEAMLIQYPSTRARIEELLARLAVR